MTNFQSRPMTTATTIPDVALTTPPPSPGAGHDLETDRAREGAEVVLSTRLVKET